MSATPTKIKPLTIAQLASRISDRTYPGVTASLHKLGWFTDGHFAVRLQGKRLGQYKARFLIDPDNDREPYHMLTAFPARGELLTVGETFEHEFDKGYSNIKTITELTGDSGTLWVEAVLLATVLAELGKDVLMYGWPSDQPPPVTFESGGAVVGLLMPLSKD